MYTRILVNSKQKKKEIIFFFLQFLVERNFELFISQ